MLCDLLCGRRSLIRLMRLRDARENRCETGPSACPPAASQISSWSPKTTAPLIPLTIAPAISTICTIARQAYSPTVPADHPVSRSSQAQVSRAPLSCREERRSILDQARPHTTSRGANRTSAHQGRVRRRCHLRQHEADAHHRRAHRAPRLRRLHRETTKDRHRPQSQNRCRSQHRSRQGSPFQTR